MPKVKEENNNSMCRGSGKETEESESAENPDRRQRLFVNGRFMHGGLCVQPVENLLISR